MRQSYKGDEKQEGQNVILKRIDLALRNPSKDYRFCNLFRTTHFVPKPNCPNLFAKSKQLQPK